MASTTVTNILNTENKMSKIETALEQIEVKEVDKNRSTEDLLMDVIGCLVDANRNKDKRANIPEFIRVKDLFINSYPKLNYFNKDIFQLDYNYFLRDTLEDHLACAVIKLLEIVKMDKLNIPYIDYMRNYTRGKFKYITLSSQLLNVIGTPTSNIISCFRVSAMPIQIEVICELLNIDLWHHVELRLKYQNI